MTTRSLKFAGPSPLLHSSTKPVSEFCTNIPEFPIQACVPNASFLQMFHTLIRCDALRDGSISTLTWGGAEFAQSSNDLAEIPLIEISPSRDFTTIPCSKLTSPGHRSNWRARVDGLNSCIEYTMTPSSSMEDDLASANFSESVLLIITFKFKANLVSRPSEWVDCRVILRPSRDK